MSNHKFKIGQSVNYTAPFGAGSVRGVYKITRLLPPESDDFQYKIKSAAEPHESRRYAGTLIEGHLLTQYPPN